MTRSREATGTEAGRAPARIDAAWRTGLVVALASRAIFFPIAWGANWFLASSNGGLTDGFFGGWLRWDAVILLRIAEHGYTATADPHAAAFFPLFPMLTRALGWTGMPLLAAGLLISAVSSVVAFAYLYRLAEEDIGEGAGRKAVLYLALFPTGVFLIAPYTEALFLAGAIPAFYYARRRRWLAAGIPAAIAVGARFAGVFLLFGLAVEFLRQRDFTLARVGQALVALATGIAPLGAYVTYLWLTHRGAFAFITAQKEGWGRTYVGPWRALETTLFHTSGTGYPTNWIFAWKVEVVAAAIGLALTVLALARREWGYGAFMAATMMVLVTSTWYYSIPRMLLSLFPIMLFLAARTTRRPHEHEWALITLAPLATLGVIVFARSAWFF